MTSGLIDSSQIMNASTQEKTSTNIDEENNCNKVMAGQQLQSM
jgi:hypothetical protein